MPTYSTPGAVLSAPPGGSGVVLADVVVAGADSLSISSGTFSVAYALLLIFLYTRTDETVGGNTSSDIQVRLNGDSGANYDIETLDLTNGSVSGVPTAAATYIHLHTASNSTTTSVFGSHRIAVPNYSGTVGFKSMEVSGGIPSQTAIQTKYEAISAQYRSTSAISQVALTSLGGGKFKVGSRMTILGF